MGIGGGEVVEWSSMGEETAEEWLGAAVHFVVYRRKIMTCK